MEVRNGGVEFRPADRNARNWNGSRGLLLESSGIQEAERRLTR
jgi:hypothetical protein